MAEIAGPAASSSDAAAAAAAQRASEQARLRRERREAKIRAGGAARLNKINGMAGRIVRGTWLSDPVRPSQPDLPCCASQLKRQADGDDQATPTAADKTASPSKPATHGDPDEVDISQHLYAPQTTARPVPSSPSPGPEPIISEARLRQMMLGFDRPSDPNTPGSSTPSNGNMPNTDDDPLMKMMAQVMGQAGTPPFPGMGNMSAQQVQQQGAAAAAPSAYHTTWRLVHALVALSLGLYLTLLTTFSGTKAERDAAALAHVQHTAADDDNEHHKRTFFWVFATSEAVLLTTRVFLDRGRAPPPGILWTVAGFLPDPVRGYVSVLLKHGQIFTTVRTDVLTCMFVLGACSWLRS
ncbi:GET complex, subunit GET2 [Metarhizium album ARSEF 1941]|uniref:GET complex, subunit GET2 n=1 Tax=Metarhizium album (strain ARSEF 1941) TaxID=1081103 RepID=A0A0B2X9M7_METAS|nr:GET complex, subunit GET2 [Metarhizium album ARSEF 1941]KHO02031.1 GET complex, subunit GET2 [Metarhizium album ARSEF 1941]